MARILLGVSGGISAYKSLELARLATKEGHAVRVVMTPTAEKFIGRASFEGIVGAPVLIDEFERDPARGAFPGDPVPEHDPIGHLVHGQRKKRIGHTFPERDYEHRRMFSRRNSDELSSHARGPHVMTGLYFFECLIVVDMLWPIVKIDNDFGVAIGQKTID